MLKNKEIIINEDVKRRIEEHVLKTYPLEGCGILLGNNEEQRVSDFIPMVNSAFENERKEYFEISPLDILRAEAFADEMELEIIGFFHSHPDKPAIPSVEDEKHMVPGMINMILSAEKNEIKDIGIYIKEI